MELNDRLVAAINNYMDVALILRRDLTTLHKGPLATALSRRNYIRSAVALLEGACHCYLDLCAVMLECGDVDVSKAEECLILDRRDKGTPGRIKLALRLVHRLFATGRTPDFGGSGWIKAQEALDKRHHLMHPKHPQDLDITETEWDRIYQGINWLQEEEFQFTAFLAKLKGQPSPPPDVSPATGVPSGEA